MCDSHAWSRYTRIYPDRMVSVGSVAVKAKVIALYAVVLSNANHRRQNVRRGEANRRLRPDDAALKPDPPLVALSARLTASVYIYIYIFRLRNSSSPNFLSNFAETKEKFFPPPRIWLRIWLKTD